MISGHGADRICGRVLERPLLNVEILKSFSLLCQLICKGLLINLRCFLSVNPIQCVGQFTCMWALFCVGLTRSSQLLKTPELYHKDMTP